MDNPDIKFSAPAEAGPLQAQLESLHHLVVSLLVLMVVVSGTLSIFLLRQCRMSHKDLAATRPVATQIISDYNRERAPKMEAFIEKLKEYGKTHPDFTPILVRYGLSPNTAAPAPAPAKK